MQSTLFEASPKTYPDGCPPKTTLSDASSLDWWERMMHSRHSGTLDKCGQTLALLLDPKEPQRGGFWMRSFSDWPNAEDASLCSLSGANVSCWKCAEAFISSRQQRIGGILRRAEKRGKQLPAVLRQALETVALAPSESETPAAKIA